MKTNVENEVLKRKYLRYLREACGSAESTIVAHERNLATYEEFSKYESFGRFSIKKACAFKEWLKNKRQSVAGYGNCLKHLQKFYKWLSMQPGYKSKIVHDAVDYLKLSNKDASIMRSPTIKNYPTLESAIKLAKSIEIKSEVDFRDRAIVAFLTLSGMRDSAVASLPLMCFDEEKRHIHQNPKMGVNTKFSKTIFSKLFNFDETLLGYVLDWVKLLKEKGYGMADPLFPRSKIKQEADNISFSKATEVEAIFWHGGGPVRGIIKTRAEAANLHYYPPHRFRHLACHLALKMAKNAEELKAISQNFGHEYIQTTLSIYGNYQPEALLNKLDEIDGRGK